MIPLPRTTDDQNIKALARVEREDVTNVSGPTITLTQNPVEAASPPGTSQYILVWKNGSFMHNIGGADYTVTGKALTFSTALVNSDKLSIFYYARAS